jgi:hypothetical protein
MNGDKHRMLRSMRTQAVTRKGRSRSGGAVLNLTDAGLNVTAHVAKGCTGAGGERTEGSAMIQRIQLKCNILER